MAQMQVRDGRPKNFFWCDNIVIDKYARQLGPYALSVYMAMLRHADNRTQSCFPSLKTLAEELGMGKDSVIKAIGALKKAKLISVKHRLSKAGDATSNLYFIRGVVDHTDHLVDDTDHGRRPHRQRVVGHVDTNKTQVEQDLSDKGEALIAQALEAEPTPRPRCVGYPSRSEGPRYCAHHGHSHCVASGA
jgi:hypothetical protein